MGKNLKDWIHRMVTKYCNPRKMKRIKEDICLYMYKKYPRLFFCYLEWIEGKLYFWYRCTINYIGECDEVIAHSFKVGFLIWSTSGTWLYCIYDAQEMGNKTAAKSTVLCGQMLERNRCCWNENVDMGGKREI